MLNADKNKPLQLSINNSNLLFKFLDLKTKHKFLQQNPKQQKSTNIEQLDANLLNYDFQSNLLLWDILVHTVKKC